MINKFDICESCPMHNNAKSYCKLFKKRTYNDGVCLELTFSEVMDYKQAATVLHYHQKWRKGAKIRAVSPKLLTHAINIAIMTLRETYRDKENGKS